ncbi:hypothetical protein N864_07325 [Intrasporangium chromatireducens Q5-1]|uniref:Bacterial toxin 24 domain-containing protein n=1 Tax=Intrasporangium chromatireducens Q5-1 TaxID=584657 RepID=W9GRI9_9MICO|nr:hypothetical protein [Intrasporangium chromatireducens]EWT07448.1 hypothetical protein N864_07325 [Intrasporangium chromatireducens Q5-1]
MRGRDSHADAFDEPSGDPAALRAAARRCREVSERALATAGVRGDAGVDLALFWTGPAADAAQGELTTLSGRALKVLPQVAWAALSLTRYADALEHAIRQTRRLRWQATGAREEHARLVAVARTAAVDPVAVALAVERADEELVDRLAALHRAHGRVMDEFMAAGLACARTLSQLAASAAPGAGTPTAAAASEAVLQGLPLAREQIRLASVRPVGRVVARPEPAWWQTALEKASEAGAWTWNHTAVPLANGAANVAEAAVEHPEDLVDLALGTGMIILGGAGMAGGTALDATGAGAVAGVPIQFAAAAVTATGVAAASHGAGDLLDNAARKDGRLLREVEAPTVGRGTPGEPLPDSMRPDTAGANWKGRVADNGKGEVWQAPEKVDAPKGAPENADSIRIMGADRRYPRGYVRFYNSYGQPLRLDGRTGTKNGPDTHIEVGPDGTYEIPIGWGP